MTILPSLRTRLPSSWADCECLILGRDLLVSGRILIGTRRTVNRMALRYYMQYFDMKAQTLVEAFRYVFA